MLNGSKSAQLRTSWPAGRGDPGGHGALGRISAVSGGRLSVTGRASKGFPNAWRLGLPVSRLRREAAGRRGLGPGFSFPGTSKVGHVLAKAGECFVGGLSDLTCCEVLATAIKRVDNVGGTPEAVLDDYRNQVEKQPDGPIDNRP